jgi:glycosyltransferase involved in cell wall biosynthesis
MTNAIYGTKAHAIKCLHRDSGPLDVTKTDIATAEKTMTSSTPRPTLLVVSTSKNPCGVEGYTRVLISALQQVAPNGTYEEFRVSGYWSELPSLLRLLAHSDSIVFSLPLVAWKRTILLPWIILVSAFLLRRPIFLFLHEWASLHSVRRLVFLPFVFLSKTIIVLSPYIRDQLASDRWVSWTNKKWILGLHSATVRRPDGRRVTEIVHRIQQRKTDKSIVIGHFGSIYKGKGTDALLDACAHICQLGIDSSVVFIGEMTKSLDGYENDFRKKIKELKLEDRVIVTGYIDDEEELFAIFDQIDVFLYIFPEGMTARRSSVLVSLQSGRPVLVSAPISSNEFSHHRGYTSLIESGAIIFFPSSATTKDLAGYISSAAQQPNRASITIDYDAWWNDAARNTDAILHVHARP